MLFELISIILNSLTYPNDQTSLRILSYITHCRLESQPSGPTIAQLHMCSRSQQYQYLLLLQPLRSMLELVQPTDQFIKAKRNRS